VIAQHLLDRGHIGISPNHHYHSLDHMFLGVALHSPLRNSLPLISAAIYCAVARRFNLQASPCSFPFHVHAIVRAPDGFDLNGNLLPVPTSSPPRETQFNPSASTTLYMDPFHTPEPVAPSTLIGQLSYIARQQGTTFSPARTLSFLSPAGPRDIAIRAALNIQNSPQQSPPPPTFPISTASAAYSAAWALTILSTHPLQLRQNLAVLFNQFVSLSPAFTHDLPLIERYILPLAASLPLAEQFRHYTASLRASDTTPKIPKRRSDPANHGVKYKIGQVFRHRMRNYLACITGWDAHCNMPEGWIMMNQVGRLARGKHQPFYNVM
jgi:F-box protein 21